MASLSPLLLNFSAEDVAQLSNFGESCNFATGETIMEEGADNRHLYIILKGSVEVSKKGDTGSQRLAQVAATGSLGEMSIFDPGPSSATVKALSDVEVWRTTLMQLDRMHEVRPKVAYRLVSRICTVLAKRLRQSNERVMDSV